MEMSKYCVESCNFLNYNDKDFWCSYHNVFLKISYDNKKLLIGRCTECIEEEKDWAVSQMFKDLNILK